MRHRIWAELDMLAQGARYDLNLLSLEELFRIRDLLAKRQQVGIEGLEEEDLSELECLLMSALCPPAEQSALLN